MTMQVNVHARRSAYNTENEAGLQGRDVTSGEQHSVKILILREVQNNDPLIVRCTKWRT